MADLEIRFEWEDPGGAKGPELCATWARLQIVAGGRTVTRLEDTAAGAIRDAVYAPLYPLAEWMATNWWALLYEVPSATRLATAGYARRHGLAAAREGFALPALAIQPEGARVELRWQPVELPDARVPFTSGGSVYVDRGELWRRLASFIEAVVARLDQQGVSDTLLAEEWKAIRAADEEEAAFCRAASQLGLDPYSLDDDTASAIMETWDGSRA